MSEAVVMTDKPNPYIIGADVGLTDKGDFG